MGVSPVGRFRRLSGQGVDRGRQARPDDVRQDRDDAGAVFGRIAQRATVLAV